MNDPIERQAAIGRAVEIPLFGKLVKVVAVSELEALPSAQPDVPDTNDGDMISRQAAMLAITERMGKVKNPCGSGEMFWEGLCIARSIVGDLPSAQPERTCVNCGRTANNGGWYADGRTRCPIEEHYALPKDGFCHLWEKRNVTDDDYPERREE